MAKKKKNKYTVNILWKDRRRRLGMPLSFQRYRLGEDRLFYEKGFLSTTVDDILLYRVRDISVKISFWQRLTGVGTVTVNSSDQTMPVLVMRDIKRPREVKEMLHQQVEKAKIAYRVRYNEMMGAAGDANGMGSPMCFRMEILMHSANPVFNAQRSQREPVGRNTLSAHRFVLSSAAAAGFKLKPFCVKSVSLHGFLNNHIQSGIRGI